jgi:circadian clock protein KaiB
MLQLYVAGMTLRSMEAIERVRRFCEMYFKDMFELEIIDIYKHPELAMERQIIFSPSLVKRLPLPRKVIIGDFSNKDTMLRAMGITANDSNDEPGIA